MGITQAELAAKVGISVRGFQGIEYGIAKDPGYFTMVKIAKALNLNLDFTTNSDSLRQPIVIQITLDESFLSKARGES